MRLNDKLIRENCPACGGEITLEASSLDKKINCPRCRQTVIIPNGHPAPKKNSSKKAMPKEKRNGGHPPLEKAPAALEELRISIQRRNDAKETPPPAEYEAPLSEKRAVVYCICNGVLKRCTGSSACCVKDTFCVYADELEM